jgi:hypothetical protein
MLLPRIEITCSWQFVVCTRVQVSNTDTSESLRLRTKQIVFLAREDASTQFTVHSYSGNTRRTDHRPEVKVKTDSVQDVTLRDDVLNQNRTQTFSTLHPSLFKKTFLVTLPYCVLFLSSLSLSLLIFADWPSLCLCKPQHLSSIPSSSAQPLRHHPVSMFPQSLHDVVTSWTITPFYFVHTQMLRVLQLPFIFPRSPAARVSAQCISTCAIHHLLNDIILLKCQQVIPLALVIFNRQTKCVSLITNLLLCKRAWVSPKTIPTLSIKVMTSYK